MGAWHRLGVSAALAGALLTAGCGSLLIPASGPNSIVIRAGITTNGPDYGLVKLTPAVIKILDEYGPRTLSATFGDHRPPPKFSLGLATL